MVAGTNAATEHIEMQAQGLMLRARLVIMSGREHHVSTCDFRLSRNVLWKGFPNVPHALANICIACAHGPLPLGTPARSFKLLRGRCTSLRISHRKRACVWSASNYDSRVRARAIS